MWSLVLAKTVRERAMKGKGMGCGLFPAAPWRSPGGLSVQGSGRRSPLSKRAAPDTGPEWMLKRRKHRATGKLLSSDRLSSFTDSRANMQQNKQRIQCIVLYIQGHLRPSSLLLCRGWA